MAKTVRLQHKRKPEKKYNLDRQVKLLPREISVGAIKQHLQKFGVTHNDFYRDRRIPYGSGKSIPSDRLLIYAQVFECTIDDLTNHEVKATSIREALESPKQPVAASKRSRTGLK